MMRAKIEANPDFVDDPTLPTACCELLVGGACALREGHEGPHSRHTVERVVVRVTSNRAEKLLAVKQWVTAAKEQAEEDKRSTSDMLWYHEAFAKLEDKCSKALAALSELERL